MIQFAYILILQTENLIVWRFHFFVEDEFRLFAAYFLFLGIYLGVVYKQWKCSCLALTYCYRFCITLTWSPRILNIYGYLHTIRNVLYIFHFLFFLRTLDYRNYDFILQVFQGQPTTSTAVTVPHPPSIRPRVRARRGQATDPHSIAERVIWNMYISSLYI